MDSNKNIISSSIYVGGYKLYTGQSITMVTWGYLYNYSSFTTNVWNSISSTKLSAGLGRYTQ